VPHSILRLDEIEAQNNVSRSVVREVTRVLSSKGMMESRRRLGMVVQPEEYWSVRAVLMGCRTSKVKSLIIIFSYGGSPPDWLRRRNPWIATRSG
jgi:DNA-binding FadR family transcriptional regulator